MPRLIITGAAHFGKLTRGTNGLGFAAAPDDRHLALRGLRARAVRLCRHQENGLILARWLSDRSELVQVVHPALPALRAMTAGHANWCVRPVQHRPQALS